MLVQGLEGPRLVEAKRIDRHFGHFVVGYSVPRMTKLAALHKLRHSWAGGTCRRGLSSDYTASLSAARLWVQRMILWKRPAMIPYLALVLRLSKVVVLFLQ